MREVTKYCKWEFPRNQIKNIMIVEEVYLGSTFRIHIYKRKREEAGVNRGTVGPSCGLDRGPR